MTNHEAYAWEGAFEDYLVDSEVTLETWLEVERINFEHCAENLLEKHEAQHYYQHSTDHHYHSHYVNHNHPYNISNDHVDWLNDKLDAAIEASLDAVFEWAYSPSPHEDPFHSHDDGDELFFLHDYYI